MQMFNHESTSYCKQRSLLNETDSTFVGIHSSNSIKCTNSGLSGFGSGTLKHGSSLRQEMILHGLHEQLLAFQVFREHFVVLQICEELRERHQFSGFHLVMKG